MVHYEESMNPRRDTSPMAKRPKVAFSKTSWKISHSTVNNRHPLNVKPSGNSLLYSSSKISEYRTGQMGYLSPLSDEVLMMMLGYISDVESLKNLSHISRVMYAYLFDEELWKTMHIKMLNNSGNTSKNEAINWKGSWRSTLLGIKYQDQALLQLEDGLLCSDILYRPFQCAQVDYQSIFKKIIKDEEAYHKGCLMGDAKECLPGKIQRFREDQVSLQEFNDKWHDYPFILTADQGRWPSWTMNDLLSRFSDVSFRQEAVQWTLSSYSAYFANNKDESPLYLFDCNSPAMKILKDEYESPKVFQQDFFSVFQKVDCRPDYAWLIVGPSRSGSTFHKDPNYTSAWNAALSGRKLWIMLPSHITPPGVGTDVDEKEVTSPVGIAEWVISGFFNDCLKIDDCLIGITFPGECMHVPSGWWHSVINIDESVALTQNFCPLPKLANTLDFFKNKRDQVSGFYLHRVKNALNKLSNTLNHVDDETTGELIEYKNILNSLKIDDNVEREDCGELEDSKLPPMPLYQLFKHLLLEDGKNEYLLQALETLQKHNESRKSSSNQPQSSWKSIASKGGSTPFSFNFDEESEED